MQRNKGATAERELSKLLSDNLGTEVMRNLEQSRSGGHDLTGVGCFALEVKRQEQLSINTWWRQALDQAARAGLKPALAYRQSRRPWKFIVRIADITEQMTGDYTAEIELEAFCQLARETA